LKNAVLGKVSFKQPEKTRQRQADPSAVKLLEHCLVGFEGKQTYEVYVLANDAPTKILVRPCYHDILKIIQDSPTTKRWTINGNPGIGKSIFAHLIMSVLLRAGKRIIYRVRGLEPVSLHVNETPHRVPLAELEDELMDPSVVYVVDDMDPVLPHGHRVPTILVCSPKKAHWHDFMKAKSSEMVYMAVWTLEELEQCRAEMYPQVSSELLMELFSIAEETSWKDHRIWLQREDQSLKSSTTPAGLFGIGW
jgi:hypothetical protein